MLVFPEPDGPDPRGPFRKIDTTANGKGGRFVESLYYPLINPYSKEEVWPRKGTCWRHSKEEMARLQTEKRLYWGVTGTATTPMRKLFISEAKQGMTTPTPCAAPNKLRERTRTAGLVCVGPDGTRRWRAKLVDPDLLPAIDADGFCAAGSLSARRSIIVDAVGRTVGRLGRAAVFAEAEGGDREIVALEPQHRATDQPCEAGGERGAILAEVGDGDRPRGDLAILNDADERPLAGIEHRAERNQQGVGGASAHLHPVAAQVVQLHLGKVEIGRAHV